MNLKLSKIMMKQDGGLSLTDFSKSKPSAEQIPKKTLKKAEKEKSHFTKPPELYSNFPTILQKNSISTKADMFSLGIILFCLKFGTPPFEKASPKNPGYQSLTSTSIEKREKFWNSFEKNKGVVADDKLKALISDLVSLDPGRRPSIQQVSALNVAQYF